MRDPKRSRLLQELLALQALMLAQDETRWYRGLSRNQMKAIQLMSDSLRDDLDQNTVSRVVNVLHEMGLDPMPAHDTLRFVIRLSQGSDLAFLWFLMEMCYKSPNHGSSYNANEQILMSSIFWLDLDPTLKELDRWLPLPHKSQADRGKAEAIRERRRIMKKEREEERQRELAKRAKQQEPLAPYFQEQEPHLGNRMRSTRRLLSAYPDRPAFLSEMQDSQKFRSSPMHSRWFGDYNLSSAKRVARTILNEEINCIFKSFQAASLPPAEVESLCAHHQHIREMEKSLRMELDLIKQRKCEELIMAKNRSEQQRRKLVVQELEEMSATYLKRFRELAARSRLATTRKHLFGGGNYFAEGYPFHIPMTKKCNQMRNERRQREDRSASVTLKLGNTSNYKGVSPTNCRLEGGAERKSRSNSRSKSKSRSRSKSRSSSKSRGKSHKSTTKNAFKTIWDTLEPPAESPSHKFEPNLSDIRVKLLKGERPIVPNCPDFQLERPECAQCHTYDPDMYKQESKTRTAKDRRPSSLMQFLHLCGSAQNVGRDLGSKWNQDPSSHPDHSRKFVELGPPGSSTVKFDYRGLFGSLDRTRSDEEQMRLKEAFVRAIDDDVQYLSAVLSDDKEGSIDSMVDRAAKKVFAKDVKIFHEELRRLLREKAAERAAQGEQRLDFGREYYDFRNLPLMQEMLRLGLQQVAKDKRYILPSLPNVHTAPYLVEWICQRYGKRYSESERHKSFRESKMLIQKIVSFMRGNIARVPRINADFHIKDTTQLRKVAEVQKLRLKKRLADSFMEVCRAFYLAMRPQLCSQTMRATFYAYTPAHYNDMRFSIPTNRSLYN